ncbi:MAG: tRNA 2-thiouridine(34) synthase MnmA, partial [Bacillota bacterium]|nr:tRNA 2-thiouridine(34) synthase MnmA [Bacillota bacterium]
MKSKVVLGLSGGVDSTAAALLLQEKGYEVIGLYFDVQAWESGRKQAEQAARQLGIDFLYRDVSAEFESIVIDDFCREYSRGRTPNPCIVCNPSIKFRTLLEAADSIGAEHIATGHYADTFFDEESGLWYIKRAASEKKDQSYMLYRLGQETISRLLLPLNSMEDKEKVRDIAREKELANADARDSQEICFIDDSDDYKAFLSRRGVVSPAGDFVDRKGNKLGEHRGILSYTIGQRKGLGIALGKPVFVTKIDSEKNQVVLGENEELFTREVVSQDNILFGKAWADMTEAEQADCKGRL